MNAHTTGRMLTVLIRLILLAPLFWAPFLHAQGDDADPLIGFNRGIHKFNVTLDTYIMKPVATGYDNVVPEVAKRGVSNFFSNLGDVNVLVNNLLQLKFKNALQDSGRLVVNTTIGIGGLIDVATGMGLEKHDEDFGQTLGYWGVGPGPYVELPLLGSFTVRDAVGYVPDYLLNPVSWIKDDETRYGLIALDAIDTRRSLFAAEDLISGDEYIFIRDAYLQRREYLVNDGVVYDEWDDF